MLPMHNAKALHHHLIVGCLLNQKHRMHNAKALHHHLMTGCLLLPEKACTCGGEPLRVRPQQCCGFRRPIAPLHDCSGGQLLSSVHSTWNTKIDVNDICKGPPLEYSDVLRQEVFHQRPTTSQNSPCCLVLCMPRKDNATELAWRNWACQQQATQALVSFIV